MSDFQYVETKTGGCVGLDVDRENLECVEPRMMFGEPDWSNLPRLDIREGDWLPVENQASQGACQGHSVSTALESAYFWATGQHVQLSRACGYYETQKIDGIRGDKGSTIMGGVKLIERTGLPSEANWPYPSRYNPGRPSGYESMPKWKSEGHEPLRSYEQCIEFLARRKGAIHIGISWGGEIDSQVGRNGCIESFNGRSGGGHAICLDSYDVDKRDGDKPYINLQNSWSKRWGRNGYAWVSPRAIDQMLQDRWTVFVGIYGSIHPEITEPMAW